jgi:RNA polymerase sigma factor (sigma-70 family)
MPYESLVRVASSSFEEKQVRDEAFTELVHRFQPMVMFHANRTLGDPHKAQDAAQSTFLEAFKKLNQLQNPLAFPSWLRRIVQTQCHRQIRKQRKNLFPIDEAFQVATTDPGPLELVEKRERADRLSRALDKLPESERVPTRMFYFERLSHAEIADQLGIPAKTVKSRLHSARGRLRGFLERKSPTLERLTRKEQPVLQVADRTTETAAQVVAMPSRKSAVSMAA